MSSRAKKSPGIFVVLEGVDGAGTTTQAKRLKQALAHAGYSILVTREPSKGPVGRLIRQALSRRLTFQDGQGHLLDRTLALLFAADRANHLAREILPALKAGKVVISDRYLLSSLAYQGPQVSREWVEIINSFAVAPDVTLFLDVGQKTAAGRRECRGDGVELFEVDEVQKNLRQQYRLAMRHRAKREHIVVLNGELSPEKVTQQALLALKRLLPKSL